MREERAALCAITGADLLYERPPEGRPHWDNGADPEENPPDWAEDPSFGISPVAPFAVIRFTEMESPENCPRAIPDILFFQTI